MNKQDIYLTDWQRILLGNAPWEFLLEVLIRSVIIYFILLVVIRLMGKRMSGQLTLAEIVVMLSLGAIVSVPMQIPDRGLLQGVLLLFLILSFQRGLAWLMYKHKKIEDLAQGSVSLLIKNGILQLAEMDGLRISREQLFAKLRNEGIYNLGVVKRLYQECSGNFTIYKEKEERPGLSILPEADKPIHAMQEKANGGTVVCTHCGNAKSKEHPTACPVCGHTAWEAAVK